MSHNYMGRSARSLNQSAYSTGTAASTGRIVRQSPAPKFHPYIIIAVVMTIGVSIVGVVMTVVAYWPGSTSIGFNALKIVGPCILGVGGVALICTVFVVVMRNRNQQYVWQKRMIDAERTRAMWASRATMDGAATPTSSYGRPNKSILKKTPSTSTYGRDSNVFEEGSDSGIPHTNNISYEPDSDNSYSRRQHPVYKIETMPDPNAARQANGQYPGAPYQGGPYPNNQQPQYQGYQPPNHHPSTGGSAGRLNSSTESESHVPVPIRVPKTKKRTPNKQQPQYETEAYATQEPPLARGSPLVGTPDLGYMGDRLSYTSDGAEPMESPPPMMEQPKARRQLQSYENTGYDAFADHSAAVPLNQQPPSADGYQAEPRKHRSKHRAAAEQDGTEAEPRKHRSKHRGDGDQPTEGEPGDLDRTTEARRSRRKKKKEKRAQSPGDAGLAADPQLTRINIHAQPGTSVQITPGTQYTQPLPREKRSSVGSVETEI